MVQLLGHLRPSRRPGGSPIGAWHGLAVSTTASASQRQHSCIMAPDLATEARSRSRSHVLTHCTCGANACAGQCMQPVSIFKRIPRAACTLVQMQRAHLRGAHAPSQRQQPTGEGEDLLGLSMRTLAPVPSSPPVHQRAGKTS